MEEEEKIGSINKEEANEEWMSGTKKQQEVQEDNKKPLQDSMYRSAQRVILHFHGNTQF